MPTIVFSEVIMFVSLYWFVVILINSNFRIFYSQQSNDSKKSSTLVMLHVIFRHGDRTPEELELYPKDPYINETYYPLGYGELTDAGKLRVLQIGKALRRRYNDFLGTYTKGDVLAKSTDYNRTKLSCRFALTGLYPAAKDDDWDEHSKLQQITCGYIPSNNDYWLGFPPYSCPNFYKSYLQYLKSPQGIELFNENKEFYEYLSNHTGRNVTIPFYVYILESVFKSQESLGLKLPEWTNSVWLTNITYAAAEEYNVHTATTYLKRLSGGFLLKKIVDDTRSKITGELIPKNRKLFLYSGHEYSIAYVLILLDLFYPHVPPYASYLIFELHHVEDIYGIKILYEDYTTNLGPKLLKLPKCAEFCPIDQFVKLVEDYFPTAEDACKNEQ